jgi:Winged helix-turn helix
MPYLSYPALITESLTTLTNLEQTHRGQRTLPRLQMLSLLKSGQVRSLTQSAPLLGYSLRQLQRWWASYQAGGLARLLTIGTAPGRSSMMTEAAWTGLETELVAGRIRTLADAKRYLAETHAVHSQSLNGIWVLFQTRGIKLKTGRRRHRKTDPVIQELFRSGFRPGGTTAGDHPDLVCG